MSDTSFEPKEETSICDMCGTATELPSPMPPEHIKWTRKRQLLCPGCYQLAQERLSRFYEVLVIGDGHD